MNKQEIYALLQKNKLWYEVSEHGRVYDMKKLAALDLPYPEAVAKNVFVHDSKNNYYLITLKGNKRVDLKAFRDKNHTGRLSFASEQELLEVLKLSAGSVTPLGLLNDMDLKVQFYLDQEFLADKQIIGVHPNDNSVTLWLRAQDLLAIIREHGNSASIIEI